MDSEVITTGAAGTLVARISASIVARITSRIYAPGQKLPSIRAMAASMRVSKSTVVEAYDRLATEGFIAARRGSGFYVAGRPAPLQLAEIAPKLDKAIDPLWISRQSLEAGDRVTRPGCGWMPPAWMPEEHLRRGLRTLSRVSGPDLTEYSSPAGSTALRQFLSLRLAEQGIEAAPAQIVITDSGTQAIDLVCRMLLEPGDTVLVDDPCYFNFQALLKTHRVRIVSVPFTPRGPDPVQFAAVLEQHNPRLYITNSALHNPTGARLSPVIAHKILKLAEQSGLIIVEDDIFADFEFDPSTRLAAFDGLERVIHIGSFSKTLSAAARCGYIATRPDWMDALIDLKVAVSFSNSRLSAELALTVLKDRHYRKYIESLRVRLAFARQDVSSRLASLGIHPWVEPDAGLFLWCALPAGIDSAVLAQNALKEDIVLAPGNAFSVSQSAGGFMRFNVTQCESQRLFPALARLLK